MKISLHISAMVLDSVYYHMRRTDQREAKIRQVKVSEWDQMYEKTLLVHENTLSFI